MRRLRRKSAITFEARGWALRDRVPRIHQSLALVPEDAFAIAMRTAGAVDEGSSAVDAAAEQERAKQVLLTRLVKEL